jgi:hypothetical protein
MAGGIVRGTDGLDPSTDRGPGDYRSGHKEVRSRSVRDQVLGMNRSFKIDRTVWLDRNRSSKSGLRYWIHVWLFRHGWQIDKPVPLIGLDPTGQRDSAPALQAQIDVCGEMRLPPASTIIWRREQP